MIGRFGPSPADRRILGGAALPSITPWIVAVMSFTILLVAASGLLTARAAADLGEAIQGRYALTVPAGSANPDTIASRLRAIPGVASVEPVSETEMRETLRQWLGPAADSRSLPVPALVNFDVRAGTSVAALRPALNRLAPGATVTAHGESVAPLLRSLRLVQGVALVLVLLLAAAASAAVVLAARAAMDSHRAILDVLHGIGATDEQVTRLFQHRVAVDTLIGSLAGAAAAIVVLLLIGGSARWAADLGGLRLAPADLVVLALAPLILTAAATVAARLAILSRLKEAL